MSEAGLLDQVWWEAQKNVSSLEKMQIRQELALLQEVEKLKTAVDEELERQSTGSIWGQPALQIMQLPGVGFVVAMTVLSAIGDISRFEGAKQMVGHAGLGAGVHDSGQKHREKGITQFGRKELRWALVEASWQAVRSNPRWRALYDTLCKRKHPNQAIVAIARKLLVTLGYWLSKQESYTGSRDEDLAYNMLTWAWPLDRNALNGMSNQQFAQ